MLRLVLLVALLVTFIAPVVSAALVPDLTWIGGWYDGADGDEAVGLVFDRGLAVAPPARPILEPGGTWTAPPASSPHVVDAAPRATRSRAPPATT